MNRCGAPNGYLVVEVKGDDVKWRYKATGCSPDYTRHLFRAQPAKGTKSVKVMVKNRFGEVFTKEVRL